MLSINHQDSITPLSQRHEIHPPHVTTCGGTTPCLEGEQLLHCCMTNSLSLHTHTLSLSVSLSRTHTHPSSLSHSLTGSLMRDSLTLILTHTHTHTHTLKLSLTPDCPFVCRTLMT
ncbi:hypothetical protein GOP47_0019321 [Adiantum capillus-veneris]|uniref:Uncharacterized protein n=1 Tax=Adiantum capillus-veneris TaxID=13818 RepID=A0A9D4ZAE1_ADICA|nr:hypothetical protein GOP47_0019321 [Adiantum capillus-veneris]